MSSQFVVRVSLAVALMGAATGAVAQEKADKASQAFMSMAIEGNLAEVAMGQLAQKQGESADVKSFGQHMVADHKMEIAAHKRATKMKNEAVASYATESLPVLEQHLQTAQSLSKA